MSSSPAPPAPPAGSLGGGADSKSERPSDPPPGAGAPGVPPSLRGPPPRNCTRSETTSSMERFCPSAVSQLRLCRRPSTSTGEPFLRYSPQASPLFPQTTTPTKVDSSFHSPLVAFHLRFMAMRKLHTAWPEGMNFSSGSLV